VVSPSRNLCRHGPVMLAVRLPCHPSLQLWPGVSSPHFLPDPAPGRASLRICATNCHHRCSFRTSADITVSLIRVGFFSNVSGTASVLRSWRRTPMAAVAGPHETHLHRVALSRKNRNHAQLYPQKHTTQLGLGSGNSTELVRTIAGRMCAGGICMPEMY